MAVEKKRKCGFRKVGGLYLVSESGGQACDRLPFELDVCPCCGQGIKPARSWTWIQPASLFCDDHIGQVNGKETNVGYDDDGKIREVLQNEHGDKFKPCECDAACPICNVNFHFPDNAEAGLLWVGEAHYKRPVDFTTEGGLQGFSKRIPAIPKGFQVGVTWVFLAHRHTTKSIDPCKTCEGTGLAQGEEALAGKLKCSKCEGTGRIEETMPAIFLAWRPTRIERIVKQSEFDQWSNLMRDITPKLLAGAKVYDLVPEECEVFWRLKRDVDRGITLVPVPDDDKDHQPKAGGYMED